MDDLLSRFKTEFYEDNLEVATQLLQRIKGTHQAAEYPDIQPTPEMLKLEDDNHWLDQARDLFHSTDWKHIKSKDNTSVETRGGGEEFFVKVITDLDSPIFPALAVIAEVQLLGRWVETAKEFLVFSEVSKFRKLVKYNIWFPFPFSNRDCFM